MVLIKILIIYEKKNCSEVSPLTNKRYFLPESIQKPKSALCQFFHAWRCSPFCVIKFHKFYNKSKHCQISYASKFPIPFGRTKIKQPPFGNSLFFSSSLRLHNLFCRGKYYYIYMWVAERVGAVRLPARSLADFNSKIFIHRACVCICAS